MSVNRNVRLIYIYTVCCNVVFILPVIVPYYGTLGLSFRDFLLSEAVFSAVVLFAEVPSGWLCDVWRRKSALIFGLVCAVAGYSGLMLSTTFWHTAVSQGIIGIAVAMNSGTVTALLYDSLAAEGREDEYRRLDGKRHALGLYAVAGGSLAGGILFALHPKLPLAIEIWFIIAAMIAMSFVREPARRMKSVERNAFHDMKETFLYALRGHPEITGIILISTVVFTATKLLMWSQQPFYEQAGMTTAVFGAVMAGSYLLGGLAGQWSHRIEHLGSNRAALLVMAGSLATAALALSFGPPVWLAVPLFFTGTLCWGMGSPRVNAAINKRVGPERRATILSSANLMVHVLFIPASAVIGFVSEHASINASLLAIAVLIALLAGIGFRLWRPKGL